MTTGKRDVVGPLVRSCLLFGSSCTDRVVRVGLSEPLLSVSVNPIGVVVGNRVVGCNVRWGAGGRVKRHHRRPTVNRNDSDSEQQSITPATPELAGVKAGEQQAIVSQQPEEVAALASTPVSPFPELALWSLTLDGGCPGAAAEEQGHRSPGATLVAGLRGVVKGLTGRPRERAITARSHPILTARVRMLSRWIETAGEMTRAGTKEQVRALLVKFLCEEMGAASVRFVPKGISGSLLGSMTLDLGRDGRRDGDCAEIHMKEGMEWGRAEWALARRAADFADAVMAMLTRLDDIERQSLTDPLTQLYNRRSLDRLMEREVLLSSRHQTPLSVVVMDIDHFKQVNDTLGHAAGDQLLRHVAWALTQTLRRSDLAFRVGGDEFVLLLPQTSLKNAIAVVDKVRRRVAEAAGASEPAVQAATLSIGVAQLWSGATAMQVLRAADEAMYQAKRESRDCVRAYRQAA